MKTTDKLGWIECSAITGDDMFGLLDNHLSFGYWDKHLNEWKTQSYHLTEIGRERFVAFARSLLENTALATKAPEK